MCSFLELSTERYRESKWKCLAQWHNTKIASSDLNLPSLWSDLLILNLKTDMLFYWWTYGIWNCSWCVQLAYKTVQRSPSGWQKEQLSLSTVKKNGYCTQHQLIGMEGRATWWSPRSTKRSSFLTMATCLMRKKTRPVPSMWEGWLSCIKTNLLCKVWWNVSYLL